MQGHLRTLQHPLFVFLHVDSDSCEFWTSKWHVSVFLLFDTRDFNPLFLRHQIPTFFYLQQVEIITLSVTHELLFSSTSLLTLP